MAKDFLCTHCGETHASEKSVCPLCGWDRKEETDYLPLTTGELDQRLINALTDTIPPSHSQGY